MKRIIVTIIALALLVIELSMTASASVYDSYTYDNQDEEIPVQDSYTVAKIVSSKGDFGSFSAPSDVAVDEFGSVYVLDSGNNRVVVFDKTLTFVKSIEAFDNGGQAEALSQPAGIFARNDKLYISDTENGRVLVTDKNGKVIRVLVSPGEDTFPDGVTFKPERLAADSRGNVYVLCAGMYYGAVMYDADGNFSGFFGSNEVEMTLSNLIEYTWKQFMSLEQRRKMQRFLPMEYSGIDIDSEDMVYACSPYESAENSIRKINPKGNNVLYAEKEFGDRDQFVNNNFYDITADDDGVISCLDTKYNRIFQYDKDGDLLFILGRTGSQEGTFSEPVAIAALGDGLLVLDRKKQNLTYLKPTEFGNYVRQALRQHREGDFEGAAESWENALKENINFEAAYLGLGKNEYFTGNYEAAAEYFRLADNKEWQSKAFKEIRSDWFRNKLTWIFSAIGLFACALFLLLWQKSPIHKKAVQIIGHIRLPESMTEITTAVRHPISGYEDLRLKNGGSVLWGFSLVLAVGISMVFRIRCTGFRFNDYSQDVNLLVVFAGAVVLILLFTVANWALCVLFESEAHYREIFICTAYSFVPFILSVVVSTLLSHFLCVDEGMILTLINAIGILWTVILFFFGMKEMHQYTATKTVWSLLLTLVGVVLLLFLLFMATSLVQQIISFIKTLYTEISYRFML